MGEDFVVNYVEINEMTLGSGCFTIWAAIIA